MKLLNVLKRNRTILASLKKQHGIGNIYNFCDWLFFFTFLFSDVFMHVISNGKTKKFIQILTLFNWTADTQHDVDIIDQFVEQMIKTHFLAGINFWLKNTRDKKKKVFSTLFSSILKNKKEVLVSLATQHEIG
jgi:hypothetical protein